MYDIHISFTKPHPSTNTTTHTHTHTHTHTSPIDCTCTPPEIFEIPDNTPGEATPTPSSLTPSSAVRDGERRQGEKCCTMLCRAGERSSVTLRRAGEICCVMLRLGDTCCNSRLANTFSNPGYTFKASASRYDVGAEKSPRTPRTESVTAVGFELAGSVRENTSEGHNPTEYSLGFGSFLR